MKPKSFAALAAAAGGSALLALTTYLAAVDAGGPLRQRADDRGAFVARR
jgi:hypothetical protein